MKALLLAVMACAVPPCAALADDISFDRLDAFYVEQETGKLSADIAPPGRAIDFWNTVIGEGGAVGGGGSDVLLVAHFKAVKSDKTKPAVHVRVRNVDNGKIILDRRNISVFYDTESTGKATFAKAFFLEDVTCDSLRVEVEIVGTTPVSTTDLPFACGE